MPVPALQSLATKSGKSLQAVEELWTLAKSRAEKAGHKEDFAYVMGILKRMLGLTEKFRSEDAVLLAEALGPEVAGKIAAEGLPGDVREAARKAWGRVEARTPLNASFHPLELFANRYLPPFFAGFWLPSSPNVAAAPFALERILGTSNPEAQDGALAPRGGIAWSRTVVCVGAMT